MNNDTTSKLTDSGTTLVSFDVVSLFTKVPIDETLPVVESKLADSALELGTMRVESETIKDLLHLCLTTTSLLGMPLGNSMNKLKEQRWEILYPRWSSTLLWSILRNWRSPQHQ